MVSFSRTSGRKVCPTHNCYVMKKRERAKKTSCNFFQDFFLALGEKLPLVHHSIMSRKREKKILQQRKKVKKKLQIADIGHKKLAMDRSPWDARPRHSTQKHHRLCYKNCIHDQVRKVFSCPLFAFFISTLPQSASNKQRWSALCPG